MYLGLTLPRVERVKFFKVRVVYYTANTKILT